jgi:hypothetical protein
MKKIDLTHGKVALVDDDMFEYLNQWKWHYSLSNKYAERTVRIGEKFKCIKMQYLVIDHVTEMEIDHIDHDRLNNTRDNLRTCTHVQNMQNTVRYSNNTSGYKGVYWEKCRKKWRALIKYDGKRKHLGYFDSVEDAALSYGKAAKLYFGEYSGI